MRLHFDVKPKVIKGNSKSDILNKAGLCGWIMDSNGSRHSLTTILTNKTTIYAVNFEKHRKKVKLLKKGHRKIISRGHWIGYIYDFTKFVDVIKIDQRQRTFIISMK